MTITPVTTGSEVVDVLRQFHRSIADRTGKLEIVDTVASFARDTFDAASVTVNHTDHVRGFYRSVVNVGRLGPGESFHPEAETYGFDEYPFTTMTLLAGRGFRSDLTDPECPAEYEQLLRRLGKAACLGAPIRRQGTLLGELWLSRDRPFGDHDVDLLSALGAATAKYLAA
ncbi:MAG: GAF domain-containing protein [Actinomycetes bacterium]